MDEQQLRLLVRQAIARHLGAPPAAAPAPAVTPVPVAVPVSPASFARFQLARSPDDTECLIEPTVTCNHCGHCQCFGH
ncbi:MAG: hypothetical protein R2708_26975 [Vicinamibacterales bacterium]